MVLQILSHARKMLHDTDPEALQLGLASYAGLHQYLRRMDRSQR